MLHRTNHVLIFLLATLAIIFPPTLNAMHMDSDWDKFIVAKNENIIDLFKRANLSSFHFNQLLNSSEHAAYLINIKPGERIHIKSTKGELLGLRYIIAPEEIILFERKGNVFTSKRSYRNFDADLKFASGSIDSSLFSAGRKQGLSTELLANFAAIFEGSLNFVKDTRKGDKFSLLYKEEENGTDIIAAEYINSGKSYKGYKYVFDNGSWGYYTSDGVNLQRTFLQAPLDYKRVSSEYNPNRLHPVFKVNIPHRGIDYAAPLGTPVYASNDGVVIESSYTKPNGNYIIIKHSNKVITKYLHLSKRLAAKGDRVKRRQTIGRVGATGYATGPHLHYEIIIDGAHVNPRIALSETENIDRIDDAEMGRFNWYTKYNQLLFNGRIKQTQLASINYTY